MQTGNIAGQKPRGVLNRKEKLNSYGEKCIPESNRFCILNLERLGVISQMSDGLDDGHQVAWILLWGGDIRGFSGGLVYIHVLTHSELMDISRQ